MRLKLPTWLRTAVGFDATKWKPVEATRAAIGIAACMAVYTAAGQNGAGLLAEIGALYVGLASFSGVYKTRVRTMVVAGLTISVATGLGTIVGQSNLSICIAGLGMAFGAALYASLSTSANTVAVQATAIYIVMSGIGLPPSGWIGNTLAVLSGAIVQILLLTFLWPMNPLQAEREALADAFDSLAEFVAQLPTSERDPIPSTAALQQARAVLSEGYKEGDSQHEGLQQNLERAEAIRAALVAFSNADQQFRQVGREQAVRAKRISRSLARALHQLARNIRKGRHTPPIVPRMAGLPDGEYATWLKALLNLLEHEITHSPVPENNPALHKLLSVPAFQAAAYYHASRYALTVALALVISRFAHVSHFYWLPLTVAIVLRQDFLSTLGRSAARMVGTIVGVALASAIVDFLSPSAQLLAVLTIAVLWVGFAVFQASYAAFTAAVSIFVVFSVSASGLAGHGLGFVRIAATLAGSALSLAAYFLWPAWHWKEMWQVLKDAVEAQIRFAEGLTTPGTDMAALRSDARTKRIQADTLYQAATLEPRGRRRELEPARHAIAQLDRNAARVLSIEAEHRRLGSLNPQEIAAFLDSDRQLLESVAAEAAI
jgi:uncharacterized membrane protein YccC